MLLLTSCPFPVETAQNFTGLCRPHRRAIKAFWLFTQPAVFRLLNMFPFVRSFCSQTKVVAVSQIVCSQTKVSTFRCLELSRKMSYESLYGIGSMVWSGSSLLGTITSVQIIQVFWFQIFMIHLWCETMPIGFRWRINGHRLPFSSQHYWFKRNGPELMISLTLLECNKSARELGWNGN